MVAPFSKFYGKIWVGFCLNTWKPFFLEVSFSSQQKEHRFFFFFVLFLSAGVLFDGAFSLWVSLKPYYTAPYTFSRVYMIPEIKFPFAMKKSLFTYFSLQAKENGTLFRRWLEWNGSLKNMNKPEQDIETSKHVGGNNAGIYWRRVTSNQHSNRKKF